MSRWELLCAWAISAVALAQAPDAGTAARADPGTPEAQLPIVARPGEPRRWEGDVDEAPAAAVTVIEDEGRLPRRTTADLLDRVTGVSLQRLTAPGSVLWIRGFAGPDVAVLVDGLPVNAPTDSPYQAIVPVDPYAIDSVRVSRGAAPVLYGPRALGGVIELRTGEEPARVRARLSADSADLGLRGNVRGSLQGPVRVTAGLSGTMAHDLTAGARAGTQPFTAYDDGSAFARLSTGFGGTALDVSYQGQRQLHVARPALSTAGDLRVSPQLDHDLVTLRLAPPVFGPFRQAQLTISGQRRAERLDHLVAAQDRHEREDLTDWALRSRLELRAELAGISTRLGADGLLSRVEATASEKPLSTETPFVPLTTGARYPATAGEGAFGLFVYGDWRELLHGGARVQATSVTGAPSSIGISAELGARHPVGPVDLFGNFAFTQRPPTLDEAALRGFDGVALRVASLSLSPENVSALELGARSGSSRLSAQAVYAASLINRPIQLMPASEFTGARRYVNWRQPQYRQTGELELSALLVPGLRVNTGASYTATSLGLETAVDERTSLPREPPFSGYVTFDYTPRDGVFAELSMRWAAAQRRLSPWDQLDPAICPDAPGCRGTAGYLVVGASAGWRPVDGLAFTATVSNFANATYRLHGSTLDERGLSAILSVEGAL